MAVRYLNEKDSRTTFGSVPIRARVSTGGRAMRTLWTTLRLSETATWSMLNVAAIITPQPVQAEGVI